MNRTTKILAVSLLLSMTVNVFILGVWAGRFARRGQGRSPDTMAEQLDSSAPMKRIWRKQRALLQPRREAVDEARRQVRDALVAEPFHPEQLEASFGTLRAETTSAQLALHRALVDAARELDADARRRLSAAKYLAGSGR